MASRHVSHARIEESRYGLDLQAFISERMERASSGNA
jgi:hypothetical protein